MSDMDERRIAVLERFRPQKSTGGDIRVPHILTETADRAIADEFVKAGLLTRRRQSRKGFPPLYTITDAGVAVLPADAPDRGEADPAVEGAPYSPPR